LRQRPTRSIRRNVDFRIEDKPTVGGLGFSKKLLGQARLRARISTGSVDMVDILGLQISEKLDCFCGSGEGRPKVASAEDELWMRHDCRRLSLMRSELNIVTGAGYYGEGLCKLFISCREGH